MGAKKARWRHGPGDALQSFNKILNGKINFSNGKPRVFSHGGTRKSFGAKCLKQPDRTKSIADFGVWFPLTNIKG